MLDKLVRKAIRYARRADDDKLNSSDRAKYRERANKLEQDIAMIVLDRHAVQNAEIELRRAKQLFFRSSTTLSNTAKRIRKRNDAELALQQAMADSQHVEERAREMLDSIMGRQDAEEKR